MSQAPSAREVALDLIAAVLRPKRPLDDAIDDNPAMHQLPGRDRAFARLLVATVLRRLGQIDVLIADCLSTPLAPRAAAVHDILRLGIAQLLLLRTPPHAAVATSVDLAHSRGFISHKGLVNGAAFGDPLRNGSLVLKVVLGRLGDRHRRRETVFLPPQATFDRPPHGYPAIRP